MKGEHFAVLIVIAIAVGWVVSRFYPKEHMNGYGTVSGLYFNNRGNMHCFTNPYDPPGTVYCGVASKVVV